MTGLAGQASASLAEVPDQHAIADANSRGHRWFSCALSPETRARIADGVAANTRRAYGRQLEAFTTWCERTGRTALACTAETLAEYVNGLVDADAAPASIEQAMAAIRVAHRAAEHQAPDTIAARLVLRSHRRNRARAGRRARQAPPITIPTLRHMVDACDPNTPIGARDRLLLLMGLAMMARRSELAALHLSDVVETEDGLEVLVRASKVDQDAKGAVVAVPRGSHPDTDPVKAFRTWRTVLADHGITEGKVFRSVTRHGRIGANMSGDAISDAVRSAAVRANLPSADDYSAHSLRAGGATAAAKAGAPVASIAAHGRWSPTSSVVHGYIRQADRWNDNPMRGVGL